MSKYDFGFTLGAPTPPAKRRSKSRFQVSVDGMTFDVAPGAAVLTVPALGVMIVKNGDHYSALGKLSRMIRHSEDELRAMWIEFQ